MPVDKLETLIKYLLYCFETLMDVKSTRSPKANASFSMDDFAKALEQHDYKFTKGQVVRGKPFAYESEGVFVDIAGKSPAFLPAAEVSLRRDVNLAEVVPLKQERDFLIIGEANADGQVTVSLKELELKQAWDKLLEIQESGKSVSVRVTGVNKGGVTVDVEGLRGFIPRSHLMARENLPALIGERLSVGFLEINQENNKLVLSERLVAQANRATEFKVGQLVEGTISSIKPFGVFVDLDGATALLHIKQVSQSFINNLTDLFKPNQPIKAVVIEVDEWKGRIALATKMLENYPGEIVEKFPEVMAEAEQRAKKVNQKAAEAAAAEG